MSFENMKEHMFGLFYVMTEVPARSVVLASTSTQVGCMVPMGHQRFGDARVWWWQGADHADGSKIFSMGLLAIDWWERTRFASLAGLFDVADQMASALTPEPVASGGAPRARPSRLTRWLAR